MPKVCSSRDTFMLHLVPEVSRASTTASSDASSSSSRSPGGTTAGDGSRRSSRASPLCRAIERRERRPPNNGNHELAGRQFSARFPENLAENPSVRTGLVPLADFVDAVSRRPVTFDEGPTAGVRALYDYLCEPNVNKRLLRANRARTARERIELLAELLIGPLRDVAE